MNGLNRIIIHWTAGSWTPNDIDKQHYHFLITGNGKVVLGKFKPEDNINCKDSKYAAHCGGGNTGSIGVAVCGMLEYKNPREQGIYPLRGVQLESMFNLVAQICKKYKIEINSANVMTHKEFGEKHPDTSSAGKIDICFLPLFPSVQPEKVGDFIREKVLWYYNKEGV
jgi:hypothetical protein